MTVVDVPPVHLYSDSLNNTRRFRVNQPVAHRWRKLLSCTELPFLTSTRLPANVDMIRQGDKMQGQPISGVNGYMAGDQRIAVNEHLSMAALIKLTFQRCDLVFKAVDLDF